MTIAVIANRKQWIEIKSINQTIEWILVTSLKEVSDNVEAIFILKDFKIKYFNNIKVPIFINAVTQTLNELKTPDNVYRINGWSGFLLRSAWEIAGTPNVAVKKVFNALNKKMIPVPDEPGFIAARIIAMIINEAWYALEDKVSSKKEIDTAMKLGTNYPFGPFEWGRIIGEKNIINLLQKLSNQDKKYLPAPLLMKI